MWTSSEAQQMAFLLNKSFKFLDFLCRMIIQNTAKHFYKNLHSSVRCYMSLFFFDNSCANDVWKKALLIFFFWFFLYRSEIRYFTFTTESHEQNVFGMLFVQMTKEKLLWANLEGFSGPADLL